MATDGLVYVGKITDLRPIQGADFIVAATVVCGAGGKWNGVVRKADFEVNSTCIVYLPDSLLPATEENAFMKNSNWRVKMRRFKGAASEVLITQCRFIDQPMEVGLDVTALYGVSKYHKPIPAHLQGRFIGYFPDFIPKTDEPNYQRVPELVTALTGKPYYVTEKADGSSTTAYRYKGKFGLCSRNLELERDENNGYWKVAIKYGLEEKLPEGYALQWETVGNGIQGNPMGYDGIDGLAFSAYLIPEHRYLNFTELFELCFDLGFPRCECLDMGTSFNPEGIELAGEGLYNNGKQREGVVVRSQENFCGAPISFKVINLNFEK